MRSSYEVTLNEYPTKLVLDPSRFVTVSGRYYPSVALNKQIAQMRNLRLPRLVGMVSESVIAEILDGSQLRTGKMVSTMRCESIKEFSRRTGISLTPSYGIRSDDLVTTTEIDKEVVVFLTESKGTTQAGGFSHWTEAKIFHQLGRTAEVLERELPNVKGFRFGGVILGEVNHFRMKVNIGLLDQSAGLARIVPDPGMYSRDHNRKRRRTFLTGEVVEGDARSSPP